MEDVEDKNLFAHLKQVIPSNTDPIVEASVQALASLPHMQSWNPNISNLIDVIPILSWGFPLSFLVGNNTFNRLRTMIGKAIYNNGVPDASDLSEINAVALAIARGASGAENVKRATRRTPDFIIAWGDDVVELEVTRADKKPAHIERQNFSQKIAQDLLALNHPFDLVLHLADNLKENEVTNLMEVAKTITLSDQVESNKRWQISAQRVTREPGVLLVGGYKDRPPHWWPKDTITSVVFIQTVDTHESIEASPQVRVNFSLPITTYINPVRNKADFPQTSRAVPFVIAVDVNQLPDAFTEFRRSLPIHFPVWSHLSAVLVFRNMFVPPFEKIGWVMEMIVNPYATIPLPDSVLEKMQAQGDLINVWANLRIEQE